MRDWQPRSSERREIQRPSASYCMRISWWCLWCLLNHLFWFSTSFFFFWLKSLHGSQPQSDGASERAGCQLMLQNALGDSADDVLNVHILPPDSSPPLMILKDHPPLPFVVLLCQSDSSARSVFLIFLISPSCPPCLWLSRSLLLYFSFQCTPLHCGFQAPTWKYYVCVSSLSPPSLSAHLWTALNVALKSQNMQTLTLGQLNPGTQHNLLTPEVCGISDGFPVTTWPRPSPDSLRCVRVYGCRPQPPSQMEKTQLYERGWIKMGTNSHKNRHGKKKFVQIARQHSTVPLKCWS